MSIFKVELYGGYINLIEAASLQEANDRARSDIGRLNVQRVTLATEEDIQWAKAMGGPVPGKPKPRLPSEWAMEGYYVIEGRGPCVGQEVDYYDRDGIKRQGLVVSFNFQGSGEVVFDSVRQDGRLTIKTETFKIKYGR